MHRCKECGDPAVKEVVIGTGGNPETYYCYAHAAEACLLEMPLDSVRALANEIEYPFNAIAFVLEALVRAKKLETVDEVSIAVVKSARQRFARSARETLANWNITARRDIGEIAVALAGRQLIHHVGSMSREDFVRDFTLGDILDAH